MGVNRDCDEAALKRAFKKLSLKYHPDKNKQNSEKAKEYFYFLKFSQLIKLIDTMLKL